MEAGSLVALPIVLALELPADGVLSAQTLSRDQADELAALIATDLHALIPQVGEARLVLAGALFDPVELLRPGFPVWATLDDLARRAPHQPLQQVIAFGTHAGHMPALPLQPDPAHANSALRLLPLSLLADPALAEALADQVELQLIGKGEAGKRTADWLIRTLGSPLEHVRYLSRDDLLALICVQYEHVSLAPLWSLLEAALLTPDRDETVLSARGLALRYADGVVQAQSPAQWVATRSGDDAQRRHELAGVLFELRQYAALLHAHAVPLRLCDQAGSAADGWLLEDLAAPIAHLDAPALFAHEAPGLGVVAITVAQRGGNRRAHVLAHGYPLHPRALGPLVAALCERFGSAPEVQALGHIELDADGLTVPKARLH